MKQAQYVPRRLTALWLAVLLVAAGIFPATSAWAGETIKVGGSGAAYALLSALAAAYREASPDMEIQLSSAPLGSSAGIRALAASRLDVAISGRELQPTDPSGLTGIELGRSPLAFVVNGPTGQDRLSHQDLIEIFLGQRKHWPNGSRIRLLLRPESDVDSKLVSALSPEIASALAAGRKRPGMAMAMDDLENAEILSRTPGALGTISSCQMNTMKLGLQQIAIEATVSATAGTDLASRSLSRPFVVIIKDGARPAVRHFVDFLLSAEAKRVMRDVKCPLGSAQ
jgi:phosphate transport system substrate-binding protein